MVSHLGWMLVSRKEDGDASVGEYDGGGVASVNGLDGRIARGASGAEDTSPRESSSKSSSSESSL